MKLVNLALPAASLGRLFSAELLPPTEGASLWYGELLKTPLELLFEDYELQEIETHPCISRYPKTHTHPASNQYRVKINAYEPFIRFDFTLRGNENELREFCSLCYYNPGTSSRAIHRTRNRNNPNNFFLVAGGMFMINFFSGKWDSLHLQVDGQFGFRNDIYSRLNSRTARVLRGEE